jgi:hypothetical protein
MFESDYNWIEAAKSLSGALHEMVHRKLAAANAEMLEPKVSLPSWRDDLDRDQAVYRAEGEYVEAVRDHIQPLLKDVPTDVDAFIEWFEALKERGPGQNDPLFPWLETTASYDQMKWFLTQEVAGEAGFEDLLAMTQVKMSQAAKLEMARNYWDEMGRGRPKGMHGPLLARLSDYFAITANAESVVPESLALGNAMVALARHRRYAYHSVGALGVIEMTAPARADRVNKGLLRLGIPTRKRLYFAVHAVLDVKHSQEWNREVLRPLVAEDPRRATAIAEGALIRLWHGARCFSRYRNEFGLTLPQDIAA